MPRLASAWAASRLLFEKGIKGGITRAVKPYIRATEKCMKDQYSPDEPSTYFQYLDANKIYRWVQKQSFRIV